MGVGNAGLDAQDMKSFMSRPTSYKYLAVSTRSSPLLKTVFAKLPGLARRISSLTFVHCHVKTPDRRGNRNFRGKVLGYDI
jgi:hypothetical protein